MTVTPKSFSSNEQIIAWLRGLLTIAWADGNFDANEQEIIADIVKTELAPCINWESLDIISPSRTG